MPNKASQVILFSTTGCHLCDEAAALLTHLGCHFLAVDIAHDDELFSRYGVTIPVVKHGDSEINWPFSLEKLQVWLKIHGVNYNS